jgi:hypothetical protein
MEEKGCWNMSGERLDITNDGTTIKPHQIANRVRPNVSIAGIGT